MEKDLDLCYQSAGDLRVDLKHLKRDINSGPSGAVISEAIVPALPAGKVPGLPGGARPRRWVVFALAVAAAVAVGVAVLRWRFPEQATPTVRGPLEIQFTASPPENPVWGGGISPDGRMLADVDQSGTVYLRLMSSAESRSITLPRPLQHRVQDVSWFPGDERVLLTARSSRPAVFTLSSISIFDGAVRKLWEGAGAAVSPQGTAIAFLDQPQGGREIWIRQTSGGRATKIAGNGVDEFFSPAWSPDGQRLAYIRKTKSRTLIESTPRSGGPATVILSDPNLSTYSPSLCWTAGCSLVFALIEPRSGQHTANLWQLRLGSTPRR